ncbi:hypothetical protein ACC764_39780, partial [Rhizobium ruizarguesonis]
MRQPTLIARHYCGALSKKSSFTARELGDGIDFHFDVEISNGAATPHDPRQSNVALTAVKDDFFDKAPQ